MVWNKDDKVGENGQYTIEKELDHGRFSSTFLRH